MRQSAVVMLLLFFPERFLRIQIIWRVTRRFAGTNRQYEWSGDGLGDILDKGRDHLFHSNSGLSGELSQLAR